MAPFVEMVITMARIILIFVCACWSVQGNFDGSSGKEKVKQPNIVHTLNRQSISHSNFRTDLKKVTTINSHKASTKSNEEVYRQLTRLLSHKEFDAVPVVFVVYGPPPTYLLVNIDVIRRTNRFVLIVSDTYQAYSSDAHTYFNAPNSHNNSDESNVRHIDEFYDSLPSIVFHIPMTHYQESCSKLKQVYIPIGVEQHRLQYEYLCIERWIIFSNVMELLNIDRAFFGDTDVVLLYSVQQAFEDRQYCDVVMIVENQKDCWKNHPLCLVNGHTSLWRKQVVLDLRHFLIAIYRDHIKTVTLRNVQLYNHVATKQARLRVSDMQLLWLYWVSRNNNPKNDQNPINNDPSTNLHMKWAKETLSFPSVLIDGKFVDSSPFTFCNGMDAVNHTMFDHMMAYTHYSTYNSNLPPLPVNEKVTSFRLSLFSASSLQLLSETNGKISIFGELGDSSGVPFYVSSSTNERIYILSIHYQGSDKSFILPDQCRIILRTVSALTNCSTSSETHPQQCRRVGYLPEGTVFDIRALRHCEELLAKDPKTLKQMGFEGFPGPYNHILDINAKSVIVRH